LIQMCIDAAKGMVYLENSKVLHRDVCARNLLCDSVKHNVKVSDFGLSHSMDDEYRMTTNAKVSIRWAALEVLVGGNFSIKSDVWSFGIAMWEVFQCGVQPYLEMDDMEVLNYVRQGKRLGRPEAAPLQIYNIMLDCWKKDPSERPSFVDIFYRLEDFLGTNDQVVNTLVSSPVTPYADVPDVYNNSKVPDKTDGTKIMTVPDPDNNHVSDGED